MANVDALQVTLDELHRLGRVEKIDAARVEALRQMASALDRDPANAALWRQYREALGELTVDDAGSSVDEALEDLFAPVHHPPKAGAE